MATRLFSKHRLMACMNFPNFGRLKHRLSSYYRAHCDVAVNCISLSLRSVQESRILYLYVWLHARTHSYDHTHTYNRIHTQRHALLQHLQLRASASAATPAKTCSSTAVAATCLRSGSNCSGDMRFVTASASSVRFDSNCSDMRFSSNSMNATRFLLRFGGGNWFSGLFECAAMFSISNVGHTACSIEAFITS